MQDELVKTSVDVHTLVVAKEQKQDEEDLQVNAATILGTEHPPPTVASSVPGHTARPTRALIQSMALLLPMQLRWRPNLVATRVSTGS